MNAAANENANINDHGNGEAPNHINPQIDHLHQNNHRLHDDPEAIPNNHHPATISRGNIHSAIFFTLQRFIVLGIVPPPPPPSPPPVFDTFKEISKILRRHNRAYGNGNISRGENEGNNNDNHGNYGAPHLQQPQQDQLPPRLSQQQIIQMTQALLSQYLRNLTQQGPPHLHPLYPQQRQLHFPNSRPHFPQFQYPPPPPQPWQPTPRQLHRHYTQKLRNLTTKIEDILYKSSATSTSYSDLPTLDLRIWNACHYIHRRALRDGRYGHSGNGWDWMYMNRLESRALRREVRERREREREWRVVEEECLEGLLREDRANGEEERLRRERAEGDEVATMVLDARERRMERIRRREEDKRCGRQGYSGSRSGSGGVREQEEDGDMELDLLLPSIEPRELTLQILTEMRKDRERERQLNDEIFESYVTIGRILRQADEEGRRRQANGNRNGNGNGNGNGNDRGGWRRDEGGRLVRWERYT